MSTGELPRDTSAPTARSAEGAATTRSALETVGLVAGVLGLTALLFAFVLWALDPGVLAVSVGNAVFGAVALLFYAVTNRRSFARALAGRSTALIALEVLLAAGVLASVAVVNYFAAEHPKEWDLTRDQLFTLHEQSVQVARGLTQKVKIIGFFRSSENARAVLGQAVDLYRQHTDRLELEFISPDAPPPELVKKYDLNSRSPRVVVAAENGKFVKLLTPTEEAVTNALIEVAEEAPKKIYFLGGHGEPKLEDVLFEEGFASAASALRSAGFVVETFSLLERPELPKDAAVVVVAGAESALLAHEVQALSAWLDRGGRALVLLEPGRDHGLEPLLEAYGVEAGRDLVVEPNPAAKAYGFGADSPVVQRFEPHPITNKLEGGAALFFRARSVAPKVGAAGLELVTLIQTSPASWAETNLEAEGEPTRDEGDAPGPVPIAVASVKNTAAHAERLEDEARLVVVGDQHFASNRFQSISANGELFVNCVSWLAGEEDKITIRPRSRSGDRLPLTEVQQQGIVFFAVNLLPLLIIGLGFSVWAVRQRR
jgi:ABC-type uncharacterized transport system involved in gliding motility auxiliary subunit